MMDPAAASSMTMAPCPGDDEPSSPSLLCHCGGRVEFPAGVAPAGSQSVPYLLAAPAAGNRTEGNGDQPWSQVAIDHVVVPAQFSTHKAGRASRAIPRAPRDFDPICLKYIVSYLSGTIRVAAAFIGTPMEWSAKQSQTDQPFGSWADDLANAFVQLEPRKIAEHPFQGTIFRTDAAPIRISRVTATKHRVLRLRSHIAHSTDDLCFVNLQLEGVGRYAQRGHEQICGPGDLAVVDTTEPFEIANGRDFQLFCFAVPRHLLPRQFSERPRLTLSVTEAGRALSRTLSSYAELCLSSQAPLPLAALGGRHIVDLISHASDVLAGGPVERLNAPVLLSMMPDHI